MSSGPGFDSLQLHVGVQGLHWLAQVLLKNLRQWHDSKRNTQPILAQPVQSSDMI